MKDKSKVVVSSTGLVVGLDKSKRLAAMRPSKLLNNASEARKQKPVRVNKKEQKIAEARYLIVETIRNIKAAYPQGKQSRLFALRYAAEEKINKMSLQQLFSLLSIAKDLPKEIADEVFQEVNKEE